MNGEGAPRPWPGRLAAALFGVAVLAWVAFTVTSADPASSRFPLFHSDDAIPVLMANAERWTPFSLFFYGMNRFGGWPFVLPWAAHALLGVAWSPAALAAVAALWVCGGAIPLARLLPGTPRLAVLGYFALLAGSPLLRMHVFELAQVYPWQLPALLWAWDALRRLADAEGGDWRRRAVPAFAFSALATWSSSVSGPLLLAVAAAESLSRGPWPRGRWPRSVLPGAGVAAAAMLVEYVLRRWFQNYARRHFGYPFKTDLSLEPGSILPGLGSFARTAWRWDWLLVGLLCASVVGLLGLAVGARRGGRRGFQGLRPSTRVAVVALALAGASVLAASASAHVRENGYNPRYLAPGGFFVGLATLALLGRAVEGVARARRAGAWLDAGASVGALALLAVLPRFPDNPDFEPLVEAARAMERAGGGRVLLGGYWGTYLFAALASPGGLVPVPEETQYGRTPFLKPPEAPGAGVLLTDYGFDGFGTPGNPDAWLVDHGLVYRREEGSRWSNAKVAFWRYRRLATAAAAWSEPPEAWTPEAGAPLWATVEAGGALSLLVAFSEKGTRLPRVELLAGAERRVLAVEESGQRFGRYRLPATGGPPVRLELSWEGAPRPLRGAVVLSLPTE